jgi:hypothetical protein
MNARSLSVAGFVAAITLTLSSAAFAQKGTAVSKEIPFRKGSSSARVADTATWGTSYRYRFSARAGQKVRIAVKGVPTFSFRLIVPPEADGEQPDGETTDVRSWAGTLNDSGRYEINLSQTRDNTRKAPYELTLEIH